MAAGRAVVMVAGISEQRSALFSARAGATLVKMSRDWRVEHETLLLALERDTKAEDRAETADLLCELLYEAPRSAREEFNAIMARLIADAQPLVRSAGLAMAATLLSPEEAEALFTRHLSDPNLGVRIEATGRLADLARPSARPALAAALADRSQAVRFEAARGMAELRHSAGLDVLIAALDDADLRFRALAALAELKDVHALEPIQRLFRRWLLPAFDRTQAAGALARLGDPAGEQHLVQRATRKKWSEDRPMALELLGEVKAAAALSTLARILDDPGDLCRGAAARGLGRLGTAEAQAALVAALETADAELQIDIAEGLMLTGAAEARAHVERLAAGRPELQSLLEE